MIQENFLVMCEQSHKSHIYKENEPWLVKNACLYFRKIKTKKQLMAFKDITTKNPHPAQQNLKKFKEKAYIMVKFINWLICNIQVLRNLTIKK